MKIDPVDGALGLLLLIVALFLVFNVSMCARSGEVSLNLNRYLTGGETRPVAKLPFLRSEPVAHDPRQG